MVVGGWVAGWLGGSPRFSLYRGFLRTYSRPPAPAIPSLRSVLAHLQLHTGGAMEPQNSSTDEPSTRSPEKKQERDEHVRYSWLGLDFDRSLFLGRCNARCALPILCARRALFSALFSSWLAQRAVLYHAMLWPIWGRRARTIEVEHANSLEHILARLHALNLDADEKAMLEATFKEDPG